MMKKNTSDTNREVPVAFAYANDGNINCPDCGSNNNIVIADTHILEFSDEENGFCVVDYLCKNCNCKFRGNIHFKYQITSADNFRILN